MLETTLDTSDNLGKALGPCGYMGKTLGPVNLEML